MSVNNVMWPGATADRTTLASALAWLAWHDPKRPIAPDPIDPSRATTAIAWNAALLERRQSEIKVSDEIGAAAKRLLRVLHRLEPSGRRWKSGALSSEAEFADLERIPGSHFDAEPELVFDNLFVQGGPWIQLGSEKGKPRLHAAVSLSLGLLLREFEPAAGPTPETSGPQTAKRNRGGRPRRTDRDEFGQELFRRAALDAGHMTGLELRKQMKAWASVNMNPPPDERTVERWIDEMAPRNFFPD